MPDGDVQTRKLQVRPDPFSEVEEDATPATWDDPREGPAVRPDTFPKFQGQRLDWGARLKKARGKRKTVKKLAEEAYVPAALIESCESQGLPLAEAHRQALAAVLKVREGEIFPNPR